MCAFNGLFLVIGYGGVVREVEGGYLGLYLCPGFFGEGGGVVVDGGLLLEVGAEEVELVVQTVNAEDKEQDYYRPLGDTKDCPQQAVEPTQTNRFEQAGDEARSDVEKQGYTQEYQRVCHYRTYRFGPLELSDEPQREPCAPQAGSDKAKDNGNDGCEFHYHPPHQPSNKADEKG